MILLFDISVRDKPLFYTIFGLIIVMYIIFIAYAVYKYIQHKREVENLRFRIENLTKEIRELKNKR